MKLQYYPSVCLSVPCQYVADINESVQSIAVEMIQMMKDNNGIGLAANQAGVGVRMFVYDIGDGPNVIVNPLMSNSIGTKVAVEGCLSLPGEWWSIRRATSVHIRGRTITGRPIAMTARGLLAKVFQHEMDHLAGKTIIDRMSKADRALYFSSDSASNRL